MAYVAIPQADVNPDSPLTDSLFSQIRDNWIAIKDAESGAPKISSAAMPSPLPGFDCVFSAVVYGASTSWQTFGGPNVRISTEQYYHSWQIAKSGTYFCWFRISDRASTASTANVQLFRNGQAYSQIYTCPVGQGEANFTFNMEFTAGDTFYVMKQGAAAFAAGYYMGIANNSCFSLVS